MESCSSAQGRDVHAQLGAEIEAERLSDFPWASGGWWGLI